MEDQALYGFTVIHFAPEFVLDFTMPGRAHSNRRNFRRGKFYHSRIAFLSLLQFSFGWMEG
jgi:hypothetical protein